MGNGSGSVWDWVGAADAAKVSPGVGFHRVAQCSKLKLENEILPLTAVPSLRATPRRRVLAAERAVDGTRRPRFRQ